MLARAGRLWGDQKVRGFMKKILAVSMAAVAALLGGCSDDADMNNVVTKTFVGPKTMPIWLMLRQANEAKQDYAMSVEEAETAVNGAITSTGGTVRYATAVGNSRTVYGRTADGRNIVIDVDPVRKGGVTVDVCVDMYGNKAESKKILAAMPGAPMVKAEEAPAAPCPAKGCDK